MKHYANPLSQTDSYKVGHFSMYPKGMDYLQSNWTPRTSRIDGVKKVVFFGLQAFIKDVLMTQFTENFFKRPAQEVIEHHKRRVEGMLGMQFEVDHWYKLHALGYIPLKFSALTEGTEVPLRVPMFIMENTVKGYGWLVNYFESVMSNNIWQAMTSATIALRFRRLLNAWAAKTSDTPEFVDWQGHDFSFRGLSSTDSGSASGAGHLLSFAGSDTLTAMDWAEHYYGANGFVGGSVPATEHSVMCAGGKDDELETIRRLLVENPTGILSIVSDTWSLWKVIKEILPQLKDEIMARDGKLVIRPDSGDPVDIICGEYIEPYYTTAKEKYSPTDRGVVELLWNVFGGTVNNKGYKVLDPHIGCIYGDAITYERADNICRRLETKGFASTNVVLGIGSFTYQYNTRDTFGFAMKATWCEINGVPHNIFKDPVTDSGVKKSAKGRLAVGMNTMGQLSLKNEATKGDEALSLLQPIWEDGKFIEGRELTFRTIASRLGMRHILPD